MNTQPQKKFNILLIGDSCADEYYIGTCDRLSPEAPVPVVKIIDHYSTPGMAANVQQNLHNLGCQMVFITNEEQIVKNRMKNGKKELFKGFSILLSKLSNF